jgi:hypothetical protein
VISSARKLRLTSETLIGQILYGIGGHKGVIETKEYNALSLQKQARVRAIVVEECQKQGEYKLKEVWKLGKKIEKRVKAEVYAK